jgi:Tfp pilus assembly protein PilF
MQRPLWYRIVLVTLSLCVLAYGGWLIAQQVMASQAFHRAKAALETDETTKAKEDIVYCLKIWPTSAEIHFVAARTARRVGEIAEAWQNLRKAEELGWVEEALEIERLLLRAQGGEFQEVERLLMAAVEVQHPDSALILEILAPGYMRSYQLTAAEYSVNRWLELRPNSALAWHTKGVLMERLRKKIPGIQAYEKAVELAGDRRAFRMSLARAYIVSNQPKDAFPHYEILVRAYPDDVEVLAGMADCRLALGQPVEAGRYLARILNRMPNHVQALHLRGKLELQQRRPKEAAVWLKRALAIAPNEREVVYTWMRCLREVGTAEEIDEIEKKLKQIEADLDRLSALMEKMIAEPENMDYRAEAGTILIRNSQEEEGMRWLLSVLPISPKHGTTHQLLAEQYERLGDRRKAAEHREIAEKTRADSRKPKLEANQTKIQKK